jgi:hypothetical protein
MFDPQTKITRIEQIVKNPFVSKYAQCFSKNVAGNFWPEGGFVAEVRSADRKRGRFTAINYACMLGTNSDTLERLHFIYKDKMLTC